MEKPHRNHARLSSKISCAADAALIFGPRGIDKVGRHSGGNFPYARTRNLMSFDDRLEQPDELGRPKVSIVKNRFDDRRLLSSCKQNLGLAKDRSPNLDLDQNGYSSSLLEGYDEPEILVT
jgi:hypothetical protein